MNYMHISKMDIANGTGIGTVLWVVGCTHHCPDCHNPQTWDFNAGKPFTPSAMSEILESLDNSHVTRLTLSGGDPLVQENVMTTTKIVETVRTWYGYTKKIWIYTGYLYEEVNNLRCVIDADVLVDGEFKKDLKDISLQFCGSSNQRVIDIQESVYQNEIVLYKED